MASAPASATEAIPNQSSLVFQVNRNPGGPERMATDRGRHAGINRPAPDNPISLRARHRPASGLFLFKSLKRGSVRLKTRFLEILRHVVLRLVMDRYFMMFTAFFKEPEPAPA